MVTILSFLMYRCRLKKNKNDPGRYVMYLPGMYDVYTPIHVDQG
nr:MAG TPA: hypothetical protein [Caudoviricetes sp.]